MNKEDLIKKYEGLEGVWNANGAEIARQCFLRDLNQLDEPQGVTIPQVVADWIEEAKKEGYNIFGAIKNAPKDEFEGWLELQNVEIFAEAWVNGYEIEKEKLYEVKITASDQYLVNATDENFLGFLQSRLRTKFTKKELEKLGFGWVFDCPGIEIEEFEG